MENYEKEMNNELYHHGILGQKWGVRHGPPYPLDYEEHSQKEKRLNRFSRSSNKDSSSSKKTRKPVTRPRKFDKKTDSKEKTVENKKSFDYKRAAKIGATIAVAALAAYGVYKINKLYGSPQVQHGKDILNETLKGIGVSTTENGFKKMASPESMREAMDKVNPYYKKEVSKNNCTSCALSGFLRTRFGYDVKAKYMDKPIDGHDFLSKCIKNFDRNTLKGSSVKFGKSYEDAEEMILKRFRDNGAEGVVTLNWTNGGAHMFNWKIENGQVQFFDYQQRRFTRDVISKYFTFTDTSREFYAIRLDTGEFDFDELLKYVDRL